MANTGVDLIAAILQNPTIRALDNCPGVPTTIGRAVYGTYQNDTGMAEIKSGPDMQKHINQAIGFSGSNAETAVWHFSSESPVHHFVVVPWYKHDNPHGRVYAVFMAYEGRYTLQNYTNGTGGIAPTGGYGYQAARTPTELATMLSDLLTSGQAWEHYFGRVGPARTMKLKYWKYKVVSLTSAITNVRRFNPN